jgi:hypothetical protein
MHHHTRTTTHASPHTFDSFADGRGEEVADDDEVGDTGAKIDEDDEQLHHDGQPVSVEGLRNVLIVSRSDVPAPPADRASIRVLFSNAPRRTRTRGMPHFWSFRFSMSIWELLWRRERE